MQVLPHANGWNEVLKLFNEVHAVEMERYPDQYLVLLIDFDGRNERLEYARREYIPEHLGDRVFVLGVLTEPEDLKTAFGHSPLETIGLALAHDCRDETVATWNHQLLEHNASELERLRLHVRPILFST